MKTEAVVAPQMPSVAVISQPVVSAAATVAIPALGEGRQKEPVKTYLEKQVYPVLQAALLDVSDLRYTRSC